MEIPSRMTNDSLRRFATEVEKIQSQIGFKISARGWGYQLEQFGVIDKSQFNRVEKIINECRKRGILPIDFTAEEEGRQFSGVEVPHTISPETYVLSFIEASMRCGLSYIPDWWEGEEHYIQMIVEKIDLKTLFEPVCEDYHIPISTSKGWSSLLHRAEYSRRYKQAEDDGLKCVLLYCGDHDPDGLRISEFLRKNLMDLTETRWEDGTEAYNPENLEIMRFGLNYDFIRDNGLTWIDNLITGSGKNLASSSHKNHYMGYVQEYLSAYGARKCEANALVVSPESGRELCRKTIELYLGPDARERFIAKQGKVLDTMNDFRDRIGLREIIDKIIEDARGD